MSESKEFKFKFSPFRSKFLKFLVFCSAGFLIVGVLAGIFYRIMGSECIPIDQSGCYIEDNLWLPISAFSLILAALLSLIYFVVRLTGVRKKIR